ncbi:hypothetical protein [Bartonella choladocola]|uniref:ParG protein n=1 Tax=Bartonella choladocola TaxID=2750995 RepID=A0A1U9MJ81_9HYPH|nr:hypothetical protein [Bartonella choladocola]AQT47964.1 hypothetical protein BBC0122_018690 [Bartonella choladocola]
MNELEEILGGAINEVSTKLQNDITIAPSEKNLKRKAAKLIKGKATPIKMSLEINREFHLQLKLYSIYAGKSMREIIEESVRQYIKKHPLE